MCNLFVLGRAVHHNCWDLKKKLSVANIIVKEKLIGKPISKTCLRFQVVVYWINFVKYLSGF